MYFPICCITAGPLNIITCYVYNNFELVYSGIAIMILGIITTVLFKNEIIEAMYLADHRSLFEEQS